MVKDENGIDWEPIHKWLTWRGWRYTTSYTSAAPYSPGHPWAEAMKWTDAYLADAVEPGTKIVIEGKNEYWPGDGSTWIDGKMVDPPGSWDV